MPKFRKKPIVVEAMQFTGLDSYLVILDWMRASGSTIAEEVRYETPRMLIHTLEGLMAASPGDWVILGVNGEFSPCKPDIFEATYETADQPDPAQELRDAVWALIVANAKFLALSKVDAILATYPLRLTEIREATNDLRRLVGMEDS